jgi:hypothetical protein
MLGNLFVTRGYGVEQAINQIIEYENAWIKKVCSCYSLNDIQLGMLNNFFRSSQVYCILEFAIDDIFLKDITLKR